MTSLNIGSVTSDRLIRPAVKAANCPGCGAGADKRVKDDSFGGQNSTLCGNCGHDFKETP
jgi:hypothetical protein